MTKSAAAKTAANQGKKLQKIKKLAVGNAETEAVASGQVADDAPVAPKSSSASVSMAGGADFGAMLADASGVRSASPQVVSSVSGLGGSALLPLLGGAVVVGAAVAVAGGSKNAAPTVAATQTVAGTEDKASAITIAATDPNGDVLTYAASTPANGSVSVAGNVVTYTPKANFSGSDTFTVTVSDAKGLSASQTVSVTVAAVNDVPTFAVASQSVSTNEDTATAAITLGAADVDGDALTYTAAVPSNGTVQVSGSTVIYTPKANFNGSDSFVVTASDGKGGTATQTINVSVAAVNDAPVYSAPTQSVSTNEDTAKAITLAATDVDGDTLTYTAAAPARGTVAVSGSTVTYTPSLNFNGTDSFIVTASDGKGGTATQTINVAVASVNDAPAFGAPAQSVSTNEDTATAAITLAATDVDGDTLTYTAASPSNGSVQVNGSTVIYTPKLNYNGTDSFVVTASDGKGGTTTQTINVAIAPVNDLPVIAADATRSIVVAEDGSQEFLIRAVDVDSSPLATEISKNPTNGKISVVNGKNVYTPNPDFNGSDSFEIAVSDGVPGAAAVKYTVDVSVTPVNDAPVITSAATGAVAENAAASTVVYTAAASDVDANDERTYALTGTDAALFEVNATTGAVTLKASANFEAKSSYNVSVVATDKGGLTATQAVVIGVTDVNEAPVITSAATGAVAENAAASTVVYTAAASDVDAGAKLTYSLTGADAALFNIDDATGAVRLNESANFEAKSSYNVSVVATDNGGLTATQAVVIGVTDVNEKPTIAAASQSVSTNEDTATAAITLAATDVDQGDILTYRAATPSNGTVQVNGSTVVYTPKTDFRGSDSFVVTATDRNGLTATQTINVSVASVGEVASIDTTNDTVATTYNATVDTLGQADTFKFTDDSSKATNAIINGMTDGDVVEVTGASENYSFTAVGNDIQITYNNSAAGVLNQITLTGLAAGGGFVSDEQSAEDVAGFNFFNALTQAGGNGSGGGVAGLNGNLDADNDANPLTVATINATAGADAFTENANVSNSARIVGFGAGDTITVSNAATSDYSFTSLGTDLKITYAHDGIVNDIVLAGVVSANAFIRNEADAEAALGRDFFKDLVTAEPTTVSIDVGTDASRATVSGASGPVNFTDNSTRSSNVLITGFGADDVIRVTGGSNQYQFTSGDYDGDGSGDDLSITASDPATGIVNDIQILNVVNPNAFIFNQASAVQAVGFNFIVFG